MKKFRSFLFVCLIILGFLIYNSQKHTATLGADGNCKIYFVDKQLHRLVPTSFSYNKGKDKIAKKVVSEIISGRDNNSQILRIVPNIEDCISVEVSGEIAHVNLSGTLSETLNKSRDTETLFVYQLVNSLVSIDGISYVSFTVDGVEQEKFLGFLDMRGLFTADYDV